ncbi:MAG: hypothetical protein KBC64_00590 [Simkaniaceae bacterium]|nr:hypothetical protein [Simkaniaceae bacterium]
MLDKISLQIKNSWDFSRVIISDEGVSTGVSVGQVLPSVLINDLERAQNRATIERLYAEVGALRLDRVGKRVEVNIREKYGLGICLTVGEMKRLFVGLGEVYLEDLVEIYLRDPSRYEGRRFDELTKEDYDDLYNRAVPFDSILAMFCNDLPSSFDRTLFSKASSFAEMRKRVYLNEIKRRRHGSSMDEVLNYMKRINDEELPIGLIIPTRKGYHQVFRSICGAGAHFLLLKTLHQGLYSRISYQGTDPLKITTMYDDLRPNLGCRGAITTFDELNYFMNHPAAGFVRSQDELVDMDAFSLGEAHATRHAALLLHRVHKLRLVDGAGIDEKTLNEIALRAEELSHKIKVRHYWEGDSMISRMGDGHFGLNCNPSLVDVKIRSLIPILSVDEPPMTQFPERPLAPEKTVVAIWHLLLCLIGAHLRVTADAYAKPHALYRVYSLSNQFFSRVDDVNRQLSNQDSAWEKMRRLFTRGTENEFIDYWRAKFPFPAVDS